MPYQHLKREERYVIYHLVVFRLSCREIARRLDRAPSTIAREIKRNSGTFNYFHEVAQEKHDARANLAHRGRRRRPQLVFRYVEAGLREGWSPETISRRLCREFPRQEDRRVSHETIYQWVYRDAQEGGEAYRCLRRRHSRRRRQRTRLKGLSRIPDRIGIEARPVIVNSRRRFGDWESDTLQGTSRSGGGLATHVERKSRYLVAARLGDRTSETFVRESIEALNKMPWQYRKTMTADNGSEFARFKFMEDALGMQVFFAHPYSAWERGTNENTNGLLREYFPKGCDFKIIPDETIRKIVAKLNNRPRKCLGFRTPREVLYKLPVSVALEF